MLEEIKFGGQPRFETSCTSQTQAWGKGTKIDRDPQELTSRNYGLKKFQPDSVIGFKQRKRPVTEEEKEKRRNKFIFQVEMLACEPKESKLKRSKKISKEKQEASKEKQKTSKQESKATKLFIPNGQGVPTGWGDVLQYSYDEYNPSESRIDPATGEISGLIGGLSEMDILRKQRDIWINFMSEQQQEFADPSEIDRLFLVSL